MAIAWTAVAIGNWLCRIPPAFECERAFARREYPLSRGPYKPTNPFRPLSIPIQSCPKLIEQTLIGCPTRLKR